MEAIVLLPELRSELEKSAERDARSVNDLVNEAVKRYLHEEHQARIRDEIQAFIKMHPQLKSSYRGEWVAIYQQQLVDHDIDTASLYRRVRARYGNAPVLLREVEAEPDPDIWIRTPSTGSTTP